MDQQRSVSGGGMFSTMENLPEEIDFSDYILLLLWSSTVTYGATAAGIWLCLEISMITMAILGFSAIFYLAWMLTYCRMVCRILFAGSVEPQLFPGHRLLNRSVGRYACALVNLVWIRVLIYGFLQI